MAEEQRPQQGGENNDTLEGVSSRINKALQMRLSMVLPFPFVASNRWHEGMAIGALPQSTYRTAQHLDGMANTISVCDTLTLT